MQSYDQDRRNEPSPGGSGKKHEKCCFETSTPPVAEVLTALAPSKPHDHACDSCGDELVFICHGEVWRSQARASWSSG